MFHTLAKPTNGIIYFNDGSEMALENILSAEVEVGMNYGCHEDTTIKSWKEFTWRDIYRKHSE